MIAALEHVLEPIRHEEIVDASLGPLTKAEMVIDEVLIKGEGWEDDVGNGQLQFSQRMAFRGRISNDTTVRVIYQSILISEASRGLKNDELAERILHLLDNKVGVPKRGEIVPVYWFSEAELPKPFKKERYVELAGHDFIIEKKIKHSTFTKRANESAVDANYMSFFSRFLPKNSRLTYARQDSAYRKQENIQERAGISELWNEPSPEPHHVVKAKTTQAAVEYMSQFPKITPWVETLMANEQKVELHKAIDAIVPLQDKEILRQVYAASKFCKRGGIHEVVAKSAQGIEAFYTTLMDETEAQLRQRNENNKLNAEDVRYVHQQALSSGLQAAGFTESMSLESMFGNYGGGERRRRS